MQEKTDGKELVLQQSGLRLDPEKKLNVRTYPRLHHSRLFVTPELSSLLSSYCARPQTARPPTHPRVALHSPNNRSSIFLHPSFISFLFPFSSALPLRPSGSFLKSSPPLLPRWETSREQLRLMARARSPRAAPHADGRFLLPLCWLGRIVETEAHRKAGMGDRLNHRVEQKPSQKETGSKSHAGVES